MQMIRSSLLYRYYTRLLEIQWSHYHQKCEHYQTGAKDPDQCIDIPDRQRDGYFLASGELPYQT